MYGVYWASLWKHDSDCSDFLCSMLIITCVLLTFRFKVYFSAKLNIVDACVVVITLVVTMIYTFTDLSGVNLIPRYTPSLCIPS